MKVSVIMPTLNRAKLMKRALDSVLSQDYADLEIVVMDGGSTDSTREVLTGYGDRIRWWSQKDAGTSDAMNQGLDRISGDLVTFLNSDDYFIDSTIISSCVSEFKTHPELDIVCGDLAITAEAGGEILYYDRTDLARMPLQLGVQLPGAFFKRELFDQKRFDLSYQTANDYEIFSYFLKRKNAKIKPMNRPHVIYALGGMCNDVRRAMPITFEDFRVRRTYYGWHYALPLFAYSFVVSCLRLSGFRPLSWIRASKGTA